MMKIMTAMYTIKRGGSYDRFIMMLEAFLERGCEVHCLSLTPIQIGNPCFYNHLMFYPFKNKESPMAKLMVIFLFPPWSLWLGWRHKIDLIIAFGSLYAFILSFSKWLLRKPMVTLIRLSFPSRLNRPHSPGIVLRLNEVIEYLGLLFSDRIITNYTITHEDIIKRLLKRKPIEMEVLHNNIPTISIPKPEEVSQTKTKYGISEGSKIIVTAGIINRRKNMEMLIRCMPKIGMKNLYLFIVGDGSFDSDCRYKKGLMDLTKSLEVDDRVIFTGWLKKEELWKILYAANLFILPSIREGMPNAMLEALGAGLPCMGSNIAGVKDILQYDELLFDPLNEETLIEKIWQFFSDHQFCDKLQRLCQERKEVFNFDWKGRIFQMVTKSTVDRGESQV
jgi:glycosyltransferase involved in cell wall biosynthesis